EFQSDRILILSREEAKKDPREQKIFYTGIIPNLELSELKTQLAGAGAHYDAKIVEQMSPVMSFILSWILPIAIWVLLLSFLTRSMSKRMGGGFGGIGQSSAKVYMEKQTGVTFKDVAGQDEAKESLEEIIDFLHNPQKYAEIGAKLPKGALLVGSPGTGKTLLAKAVAGEANVPFFSISGSGFVEMFVGVGASRVRDLFQQASKMAPAIIFIDEIDAIGKTRDTRMGGNDEREQTLNQLLAEMDGFDPSKGVIVLAATNRPEVLDKALLRPGRFDRRIIVDRPNLSGRLQTLKVHTRNIKLAEDVDLNKLAAATAGAVGADLANLVNEAALRAVRQGRQAVNQQDLLVSFEVVIAGTEKKGTVLTDMEKRIVSYHEVGHALVAALEKHSQPVSKITIVPHTSGALGYTMQMPEEEKYLNSKEELMTELMTLVGGRAAEQLVFGVQTTGAANDIERATDLARKMVMQYGMSEHFGLMALTTVASQYLDGQAMMNCADSTAAQADSEVRDLLQSAYDKAMGLLRQHRELLDEISLFLLAKETITGDELMAFVNADKKQLPAAEDVAEDAPADSSEAPAADKDAASSADQPETGSQETPSDPSGDPS
ncbi:MAG TPA: ATP-dependent zinc metalloprotease FtsH, partial [Candidatus Avoscillospira avistercoris]|nr:ATP-dependent zinc metalloprotease FtsH [Candidatus Avoscillospira avistercoris]